ncbi:MAG: hypothetical protein WAL98_20000 [Desulfatiglandaceae bacterium]|jgi:hypothetical protein
MSEEILTEEENEVEREDVPLDEAPVEEEPEGPPDSQEVESDEEVTAAPSDDEEPTDDNPSGEEPEEQPRKSLNRLLRNKWLLLSFAGVFSGILGLLLGYGVPWNPQSGGKNPEGIHGGTGKQEGGLVQTGLQPFFVPLPEGSENIALKLDIKVRWESESLRKYKERPAFIRNSLLTYFLRAAKSKEGFEGNRSHLESEIGKVLEHSLAVKNIKVRLESVTPI